MSGHRIKLLRSDLSDPPSLTFSAHLPVFHIPEVCRQIYAETAIMIYKLNTFDLYYEPERTIMWSRNMLPAQRNAITSITLDIFFYRNYAKVLGGQSFEAFFPNLKRLEVVNRFSDPRRTEHYSNLWLYGQKWGSQRSYFEELKEISGSFLQIVYKEE